MARDRYTYLKAYRADLARVGLCIEACGRQATRGKRCQQCYGRSHRAVTKSYWRKAAQGRCISCPRRARPDARRCQSCTKKLAEGDARRRLRRKYAAADAAAIRQLVTARRAVD